MSADSEMYQLWDERKARWVMRAPGTLEEIAAYIAGGTTGRYAPGVLRDWRVREVPAGRPLRHTVQDLIGLSELLRLSSDRSRLEVALAEWAATHPAFDPPARKVKG